MPPRMRERWGPHSGEAGKEVLELREFDLDLGLPRPGPRGEDVEDQLRAIHHAHAERGLEILCLARLELLVEDDQVSPRSRDQTRDLLDLPAPDVGAPVRGPEPLHHRGDDLAPRRQGELTEFLHVLVHDPRLDGAGWRAHEDGPLDRCSIL